jgi:hypothetical protein
MVSHTFLGCRRGGLGESESSRLSPPPSFSARRHLPADASGGATQLAADLVVFSTRPMTPAQTRASLLATWRPLTPIARSSNAGSKLVGNSFFFTIQPGDRTPVQPKVLQSLMPPSYKPLGTTGNSEERNGRKGEGGDSHGSWP